MKIGFDAKRAFYNRSGLGTYSRTTIELLSKYYPSNDYFLYTPSTKKSLDIAQYHNNFVITPKNIVHQLFRSYWRSAGCINQLKNDGIQIYHGLSNEIPVGLNKTKIKSIVTIHDLIFIRYPELYKFIDRNIYYSKFKYAAKESNRVIAISKQTKNDLVKFFEIDPAKIDVVYQGCSRVFYNMVIDDVRKQVREKYNLPQNYILSLGTIEERKNLLSIVKAIHLHKIDLPLVAIGKETPYLLKVKEYIAANHLQNRIIFIHNAPLQDLPAIYQMASIFVYPSIFEGFGIPILEALYSKVPVITTRDGCFREAGGIFSVYVEPTNIDELGNAMTKLLTETELCQKIVKYGYEYAQNFNEDRIAKNLMDVYMKTV